MGGVFNFTQLESRRSDYQLDGRILVTEIRQDVKYLRGMEMCMTMCQLHCVLYGDFMMNERWELTLLHDRVVKLGSIGFGPFMQLNEY